MKLDKQRGTIFHGAFCVKKSDDPSAVRECSTNQSR